MNKRDTLLFMISMGEIAREYMYLQEENKELKEQLNWFRKCQQEHAESDENFVKNVMLALSGQGEYCE